MAHLGKKDVPVAPGCGARGADGALVLDWNARGLSHPREGYEGAACAPVLTATLNYILDGAEGNTTTDGLYLVARYSVEGGNLEFEFDPLCGVPLTLPGNIGQVYAVYDVIENLPEGISQVPVLFSSVVALGAHGVAAPISALRRTKLVGDLSKGPPPAESTRIRIPPFASSVSFLTTNGGSVAPNIIVRQYATPVGQGLIYGETLVTDSRPLVLEGNARAISCEAAQDLTGVRAIFTISLP